MDKIQLLNHDVHIGAAGIGTYWNILEQQVLEHIGAAGIGIYWSRYWNILEQQVLEHIGAGIGTYWSRYWSRHYTLFI